MKAMLFFPHMASPCKQIPHPSGAPMAPVLTCSESSSRAVIISRHSLGAVSALPAWQTQFSPSVHITGIVPCTVICVNAVHLTLWAVGIHTTVDGYTDVKAAIHNYHILYYMLTFFGQIFRIDCSGEYK